MSEDLSRLMDGDFDDEGLDRAWSRIKAGDCLGTWSCYHVIGDTLRGETVHRSSAMMICSELANEPTVLAPRAAGRPAHRLGFAWAAAATVAAVAVVGWTAVSLTSAPTTALARASEATDVRSGEVRSQPVPPDYLLAHQEYSPATAMQGVSPYLRAVAAPADDAQR